MSTTKNLKVGAIAIAALLNFQLSTPQTSAGAAATEVGPAPGSPVSDGSLYQTISGQWTAGFRKGNAAELEITFLHRSPKYGLRTEFETVPASEFRGSGSGAAGPSIDFTLAREAGTFHLRGHFAGGRGSGHWTLAPDPDFLSGMQARGYSDLTAEDMYSAAIADLRVKLIDDLRSEGYADLKFHDLFEAAAFGITPDFIREVKVLGEARPTFERLVEIRIKSKNK